MGKSIKDTWTYDTEYNGREEGCGDLIMTLYQFFKTIPSGTRVCVTAYDKGAIVDIPAWCRSTNNIFGFVRTYSAVPLPA